MDVWSAVLSDRNRSDPRISNFNFKTVEKARMKKLIRYIAENHLIVLFAALPLIVLPFLLLRFSFGLNPVTFSVTLVNIRYLLFYIAYLTVLYIFTTKSITKTKKEITQEDWYPKLISEMKFNARIQRDIAEFCLSKDFNGYDPTDTESLTRFRPIQMKTECIFAKTAKLWGSRDWNPNLTLEENVKLNIPTLIHFLSVGERVHLDGFLFELREPNWLKSEQEEITNTALKYSRIRELNQFSDKVRRCLKTISDYDPARFHCMNVSYIGRRGWFFQFNRYPIFITSFAPVYPETHSRYSFDAPRDSCFVLLQPEYSFMFHELEPDTPLTEWENPKTVRDRIRIAYKKNGRPYHIPNTVSYPPAEHIVKPYPVDTGKTEDVVQWWIPQQQE
jgi:hypothetical protein